MQNYKQTFNYRYFVGSGSVLTDTTKSTVDLKPLQLGLFDSRTYKAIATGTTAGKVPEIVIAMGSPNTENKVLWTNITNSFKTVPIRADKLISWRKAYPKRALNHKVSIGWDGVTDCKTIEATCGETYTLFVQVEGSPAVRYYGQKPLSNEFVYTAPCCGDDVTASADVEKMVDYFVNAINSHKDISPFVHASKLVNYTGEGPTPDTVCYESYTLTIADNGDVVDLAKIQTTYPDYTIERTSRSGIYSTYTLTRPCEETAPDAYSSEAITTIANCTDCPSGYTLVPKYYKFKVERSDAGTDANLTTIDGQYGDIDSKRLSYVNGTSVYIIYQESATAPSAAAAGDIITSVGYQAAYCTLDTATETEWEVGDTKYRVIRELCLVLGDDVCDDDAAQLNEIIAYYAGEESVVADSIALDASGTCANSFTIQQMSSNILTEDECYEGIAVWDDLPSFKNHAWKVCPCVEETANEIDNIGIVLTGAYVGTEFGDCSFEYDDFVELDLPKIIVRGGTPLDELGLCNADDLWPVTVLQSPVYPTGTGENVKRNYIEATQLQHQVWCDTPRWREIYGYEYDFIKRNKYYKTFYLEFEALDKYTKNTGYGGMDIRTTVSFVFDEDVDTSNFEHLLESWIASARPDLTDGFDTTNLYR